ncbi:GTP-sensing pleiotropic transcriptional regulator CodY [[Clostridium] polysaccharolyticum]|uniref:Global transcriptional regulator CodY n=1 Tax=[Clostridium] polysaccharolyticum TaxID=29364 RepID=A0A1H9Y1J9_9FIRM|nr:GTP-sensing pleiotropic transcriptional regulator CodY [[Clostridium] polysaccharolyticum]SES62640.1 transcriptional pleiotropic repressor [[Clostridium] polysaccharolyticum]
MGVELLDNTRKIKKLLHYSHSQKVVFNDICNVLSDTLHSNVLVISKKGKILGIHNREDTMEITQFIQGNVGGYIDGLLNERFLNVLSTKENVNLMTFGFVFEQMDMYSSIITPIDMAGERLGTLFIYKYGGAYDIDDIILSEYGTTVVGLEMLRAVSEENAEETRKEQIVQSALGTLTFSEMEAVTHVLEELEGNEGILVASKIADKAGITRSVIVNALRKLESAGVIETKSSGMKGTYIKVLNDVVFRKLKDSSKAV